MYTVSDDLGSGAAIATFGDFALGFDLSVGFAGEHLGYYLFDKTDKYFFNAAGASEWIDKAITDGSYQTGKTSTAITDSIIESALSIVTGTDLTGTIDSCFTGSSVGCVDLLNGIFAGGSGFVTEVNVGSDPADERSTIINAITSTDYLQSPYPDGFTSWSGVFKRKFTPTN